MNSLELLKEKVGLLLKKHSALVAENAKLIKQIETQNNTIAGLKSDLAKVEQVGSNIDIEKAGVSVEEKDKMRKQLDSVIGEIDKILVTLND